MNKKQYPAPTESGEYHMWTGSSAYRGWEIVRLSHTRDYPGMRIEYFGIDQSDVDDDPSIAESTIEVPDEHWGPRVEEWTP